MMVVHCKKQPFDVYIGRPSEWGNPFVIGTDGNREQVVAKYKQWLWNRMNTEPEFVAKVAALHGKVLGCFCAPLACHGDVLVKAAKWAKDRSQQQG